MSIFFKETKYTKVHFYLKDLRGMNKPGTPTGINKKCQVKDMKTWPYTKKCTTDQLAWGIKSV